MMYFTMIFLLPIVLAKNAKRSPPPSPFDPEDAAVGRVNLRTETIRTDITLQQAFSALFSDPLHLTVEVVASNLHFTESPVFVPQLKSILINDIPEERSIRFDLKTKGISIFTDNAGFTSTGYDRAGPKTDWTSTGWNGQVMGWNNRLFVCDHGARNIIAINPKKFGKKKSSSDASSSADSSSSSLRVAVDTFQGKRLSSPNDLTFSPDKQFMYFTDVFWGLVKSSDDFSQPGTIPALLARTEVPRGVYRISKQDYFSSNDPVEPKLMEVLYAPNGIAISDDGKRMLVGNSLDATASPGELSIYWNLYDVDAATGDIQLNKPINTLTSGYPIAFPPTLIDSLRFYNGVFIATGPNGVWIIDTDGNILGRIRADVFVASVLVHDGWLYLAASTDVVRVKVH